MSGTLQLISAFKLSAKYYEGSSSLVLYAEGKYYPTTFDYQFIKDPLWVGGLRFSLMARQYRVIGPEKEHSTEKSYSMGRPLNTDIVIVTSNNPKGKVIPIEFVNGPPSEQSNGTVTNGVTKKSTEAPQLPQIIAVGDETIGVIVGGNFKISQAAELGKLSRTAIEYDDEFVKLESAGLEGPNVFWRFKALKVTHNTPVTIWITPGLTSDAGIQIVYRVVHNVEIGLGSNNTLQTKRLGLNEPFIACVFVGLRIVRNTYPSAQIFTVTAVPPYPMPCTNPMQCSFLTLECDIGDEKLAKLQSVVWGEWEPIQLVDKKPDDLAPIPWNDSGMMDVLEADELMKAQGFTGAYTKIKMENRLTPNIENQPHYIFDMLQLLGGPESVWVGMNTKNVTPHGQVLPPLSK